MPSKLFAYGTLRQGTAPVEIAQAVARLRRVGSGVARGQLFDLGVYPGAVFAGAGVAAAARCGEIAGEIYEVPDSRTWGELDGYEGFEPSDPAASLFVRRQIEVRLCESGERAICWAYEYNRPVEFVLEPGTANTREQKT